MHIVEKKQFVPINLELAWDFFSSPANLGKITPPHMDFVIHSGYKEGQKMYPGMIISYTVKPLLGIPLGWVTEITHVKDQNYFVDEQRFGPYTFWHHQHFFKEVEGGIEMTDIVHYKIPFGIFGKILNVLFIGKQVEGIFKYRSKKLKELFG